MADDALQVAANLRDMAENLWSVEYRVRVDEDAELLLKAAKLIERMAGLRREDATI